MHPLFAEFVFNLVEEIDHVVLLSVRAADHSGGLAREQTGCGRANGLFTIRRQIGGMRSGWVLFLVAAPVLSGCGPAAPLAEVGVGVVSGASIPIFHRTPLDMAVSAATGRNCSVVWLDRGETYCRAREPKPETPEFCTRSLGVVDCWKDPEKLTDHPREVADGPRELTHEQERDRTKWWPGLW
jgi:hypothetical protein